MALDLAEAKRDIARAKLLRQEAAPSSEKYDLRDFERSLDKRQKEFSKASRKARGEIAKIDKLRIEWEQLSKGIGLVEAE